jgi:hypothetical protein
MSESGAEPDGWAVANILLDESSGDEAPKDKEDKGAGKGSKGKQGAPLLVKRAFIVFRALDSKQMVWKHGN